MNSIERLRSLPDYARVWIYVADRSLDDTQIQRLLEHLDAFCTGWRSHGRPVTSAAAVVEGRFAIIAGEIPDGDISGCGIDASVHALDRAAEELGLRWLPALAVHFRAEDGTIRSVSRPEFRRLVDAGRIDSSTQVFDLSIQLLRELREGQFEQPARLTWHERAFRLSAPAV